MEPGKRGLAPFHEGLIGDCIALIRLVVPDDRRLSASKMRLLFFPTCLRMCLVKVPEERKILGVGDWGDVSTSRPEGLKLWKGYHTVKIRPATLSTPPTICFGSRVVQCGHT